ncbi:hypothetical protein CC1G_03175 [Coprinopsis cinerea okayama7|uniref:Uncharacterized protein n=1 Tax=Coprinopsis cinerea (strain Okayama-7 / 130 / ATCC MYA-4618 / FGSC 9003) TaxID=240176 RepID=A8PF72_COPC7|nr:hypothetical protein CC1G_03175 [Coprinopsis cinerea okayama7\|eukprot:XP_001840946.2 hypothetical protein CC1G_03175 [Coprinopsis cinerea okayama7\
MSSAGSSSSSSYTSPPTPARSLNLRFARLAGWSGPPRLKLGRARELWAKAGLRREQQGHRRVVKSQSENENDRTKDKDKDEDKSRDEGVKGNEQSNEEERELSQPSGVEEPQIACGVDKDTAEAGPSQPAAVNESKEPEAPNAENDSNSVFGGSEAQKIDSEHSKASVTEPNQATDLDAGTSEKAVAANAQVSHSDNAGPNFKSNGKKKNLEKEKETVPITRRSARLANKVEAQNEDSSIQAPVPTTATSPDTSEQRTTTVAATTIAEATNKDVIDDTKPAPRRSSRNKKVPSQAAPGPSTEDVVEAVSAVVSTIKAAPAMAPKPKQTRGQKRKRAAGSEEEEEERRKDDDSGKSGGNAKSKSKDGATAKGAGTRKAKKRARKSDKDTLDESTAQAGEKENTTESSGVPPNGGQDEDRKDDDKEKLTIRIPARGVKKGRGSKKTRV